MTKTQRLGLVLALVAALVTAVVVPYGAEAQKTSKVFIDIINSKLTSVAHTPTTSKPMIDLVQTWNDAAVTFVAEKTNITNTNSGASSLLRDWQVGGTSKFKIDKSGNLTAAGGLAVVGAVSGVTTLSVGGAVSGVTTLAMSSTLSGPRREVISAASGTTNLTTAQSGALVVNTGTSSTTTFTLPTAAAGLNYCFVENGDAAGELLVSVQTGDSIIGKTHGAEDGTGISTAAGTGIKNTAATNVKGDMVCLVSSAATVWNMVSVAGAWASQ